MGITAVRLGIVGHHAWQSRPGTLLALLPEPVNADECFQSAGYDTFGDVDQQWNQDFDRLIESLLGARRSPALERTLAPVDSTGCI
jgi:hypothetical protein